jgi:hypothetical protein
MTRIKNFLNEANFPWLDKTWNVFKYKNQSIKCCAMCKTFGHPRDGHGECYNEENIQEFLSVPGAEKHFFLDKSIPVSAAGVCPRFKEI